MSANKYIKFMIYCLYIFITNILMVWKVKFLNRIGLLYIAPVLPSWWPPCLDHFVWNSALSPEVFIVHTLVSIKAMSYLLFLYCYLEINRQFSHQVAVYSSNNAFQLSETKQASEWVCKNHFFFHTCMLERSFLTCTCMLFMLHKIPEDCNCRSL